MNPSSDPAPKNRRAAVAQGLAESAAGRTRYRGSFAGRIPDARKRLSETGETVKVKLSFKHPAIGDEPYRIDQIGNEIAVAINGSSRHVGDYLTEIEATELLSEPGVEVVTVPRKG